MLSVYLQYMLSSDARNVTIEWSKSTVRVIIHWVLHYHLKGAVNIYGNTGPGNLQRDRLLFWPFVRTGPPVILKHQSTGPPIISMLFFNGARDYFQVLRYGAMDYFQWCQLYGTNNYFSIFSRILYGTKDYFPDFSTGPMIFLPFLKKFSRFLEPYCQSLKWVWRHILSQSYDRFAYRENSNLPTSLRPGEGK